MKPGTKRIICVGNRYRREDAAGPLVYERLAAERLPPDIELVDGGLGGLNLLPLMEWAERVVIVDAVSGFRPAGGVVMLSAKEAGQWARTDYGHATGLAYLLRILPEIWEGQAVPEVCVVGIEGDAGPEGINEAVEACRLLIGCEYRPAVAVTAGSPGTEA